MALDNSLLIRYGIQIPAAGVNGRNGALALDNNQPSRRRSGAAYVAHDTSEKG